MKSGLRAKPFMTVCKTSRSLHSSLDRFSSFPEPKLQAYIGEGKPMDVFCPVIFLHDNSRNQSWRKVWNVDFFQGIKVGMF